MTPRRGRSLRGLLACLAVALQCFAAAAARADDGYRLWLRYDPLPPRAVAAYRPRVKSLAVPGKSATLDAVRAELESGCAGLLGGAIKVTGEVEGDGAVVAGTPASSPLIAGLKWGRRLEELGPEGFRIRSVKVGRRDATVIASSGETGVLYGA